MPGASSPTFTIPRSFSPTHSVVGRLIRRRSGDRLRAEALYIFIITMAVVVWLLTGFAAWALLEHRIAADPTGPAGLIYFGVQIAIPIIGILVAGIGFRPQIRIEFDGPRLIITRGSDRLDLSLDEPFSVCIMDAVTYHRGLRLLESTRPFINRPVDVVLAIASDEMTVVLGLAPEDSKVLESLLSGFTSARDAAGHSRGDTPSACIPSSAFADSSTPPSAPASGSAPTCDRIISSLADVPKSGSR